MQFVGWSRMAPEERAKSAADSQAKLRDVRSAVQRTRSFLVRERGQKPPPEDDHISAAPSAALPASTTQLIDRAAIPLRANPYTTATSHRAASIDRSRREEKQTASDAAPEAPKLDDLPYLKSRTTQFLDDVEGILAGLQLRVADDGDSSQLEAREGQGQASPERNDRQENEEPLMTTAQS